MGIHCLLVPRDPLLLSDHLCLLIMVCLEFGSLSQDHIFYLHLWFSLPFILKLKICSFIYQRMSDSSPFRPLPRGSLFWHTQRSFWNFPEQWTHPMIGIYWLFLRNTSVTLAYPICKAPSSCTYVDCYNSHHFWEEPCVVANLTAVLFYPEVLHSVSLQSGVLLDKQVSTGAAPVFNGEETWTPHWNTR